ncbi:MAG: uracil-DNA glycosylase [Fimbriimonadaceae bacterium]
MSLALEQLKVEALTCTRCKLATTRTNVVFGEGVPGTPLVLVGEGPGEKEDLSGRPFVGRSGQLLDKALAENGLSRSENVYICNTVKCRACHVEGARKINRPPEKEEIAECSFWLQQQLKILAPKVILCVGAPSAKSLIKPDFKITQERGKYFPCRFARTAIATLHPAYILRNSSQSSDGGYSLLVADIAKAWEAAQRLASTDLKPGASVAEPQGSLFDSLPEEDRSR